MEIIRPTEEEMAQWKAAVQPVYEKWYGKIDPKIWAAFGYTKK
jgi:TRAP-type C4-dicarboxylate transport system substrate-binding protein